MRPGRTVVPGSATGRADGPPIVPAGPAATMRSPRTRTAQPSCTSVPSKTRSGTRSIVEESWDRDADPAADCAHARVPPASAAATASAHIVLGSVIRGLASSPRLDVVSPAAKIWDAGARTARTELLNKENDDGEDLGRDRLRAHRR